jgi:FMN phosphatase YigB (HAD superfamily)
MIKLLIFDLDNTLFDTYGQLGIKVLDEMILRMKEAGLSPEQEKVLREKYITTGFRILARQLGLSDELKRIGIKVYKEMDLSGITPFEDVKLIPGFKQVKVLVTTGSKDVQLRKVEILGIKDLFSEVLVDESSNPENKQKIFSEILKKHSVLPREAIIIGDNPESELAVGRNLGVKTAQILRRDFIKGETDYHIKDLHELKKILEKNK